MACFRDINPARVYHVPKDDLSSALTSPLLSRSNLVRRSTGDVSSSVLHLHREALASALRVNPGFRFLWLTRARISQGDAEVVRDPAPYVFSDVLEPLESGPSPGREPEWCRRVLATLIRKGILEWRVAIPEGEGIYHEKGAIYSDSCGCEILLTGSWNETLAAYQRNVERVDVHEGWEDPERCREAADWFEGVWHGKEAGMKVIPVQEALRLNLLEIIEDEPWRPVQRKEPNPSLWTPELLFLAIQDKVPWALKDPYVGTLVKPLPHQVHVHRRVLSRPPARFLLADEVGLGKTIEAGLILSTLIATGLARRVLIIAPAHVLHQWDEELSQKFRLEPWILQGSRWVNRARDERVLASKPLFSHLPGSSPHIIMVSQAIASRRERKRDFEASSWDLVILDEAHRARGHWEGPLYKKNNILKTLDSLALRTSSLLLLTATPVQLGLHELYDLLHPLGLPPRWTRRERFDSFLGQLNEEEPNWDLLFDMALESADYYRRLHCLSIEEFERDLASGVEFFEDLPLGATPQELFRRLLGIVESRAHYETETLSKEEKRFLKIILYRMSPVYQLVCRNTRNLLRRYYQRGLVEFTVPKRELDNPISIRFTKDEMALYEAVEKEYVRPFYRDYGDAGLPTHGVGFILTIYRKRAASSWSALKKSLRRRRQRLDEALDDWNFESLRRLFGSLSARDLASTDAEEELDVELEGQEEALDDAALAGLDLTKIRDVVVRERAKVHELVERLEALEGADTDSKRDALLDHLKGKVSERRGVIVFSQYKDTVDAIADCLYTEFGTSLAKYHGKGGELRSEGRWKLVPKDRVENLVQAGSLRILMATDAASEGLNLQAMDSVINYDLPWNPMRIEQRIGRIDRVTQESPIIRIGALVPEDTIEMEVYGRCLDRLDLFKQSVGPMQPVLVESFVRDIVLKGEDMEKRWDAVEREWNAAKEHARLLEEALSAQSLETGWSERKAAETRALEHLLDALGYRREGNVWVRGGHRVAVESSGKGISRITAIPHDPVFLSLLPELGPPPEFLSWSGLEYRILDAGGSRILAVRHRDGGIHIVRDISDIRADDSVQVGRNWEDARHYAMRLEKDRERSYERFMERQQEVRRKGWRRKVRTEVLQPLVRWAAGNVEKAAQQVVSDETLAKLCRRYLGATEGLASGNVKALLSKVAEKSGGRGRPPFLENIVRRARELAEGEGMR